VLEFSRYWGGGSENGYPIEKCAHEACTCVCTDGKKYCSTHREDSREVTSLTYHCPHQDCGGPNKL
jgi:hypothetical protein